MSKKKRTIPKVSPPQSGVITQQKRDRVAAILAVMIGLLSVREGGAVLLGVEIPAYHVLPWLVWYNVAMGAVSAATGVGIWKQSQGSRAMALNILTFHAVVFAGLFVMRQLGQEVAVRSMFAMLFRTFTWIVIYSLVQWKRQGDRSG